MSEVLNIVVRGGYPRTVSRIAAAGLSRVLEHMWKGKFAIISASLPEMDNKLRTKELKNILRETLGYGFIDLKGGYVYEGTNTPVKEDSVFIPNISYEEAKSLAESFGQESFIHGHDGRWYLENTKTGEVIAESDVFSTFQPLHSVEIGEKYPYLSQIRSNPNRQFRLSPKLTEDNMELPDEKLVAASKQVQKYFFYSLSGLSKTKNPINLSPCGILPENSNIKMNCSEMDCWIPLI